MPRSRLEAGFTLLEATVALTVLAVALLALWGGLVYRSRSNLASEQRKHALDAAQAKIGELRSRPFDLLITEFGPGGAPGDRFAVPAIDAETAAAEGRIAFFVDERANPEGEALGLPLDLNGDGDTDDEDVSAGFHLLPIRVSVLWAGVHGDQRLDIRTILRKERP